MNQLKIELHETVAALLVRGEPLSAGQLAAATGKSQSSISLAIAKLGDRVHRMGAARSTRYALKNDILGLAPQHRMRWLGQHNSGFKDAYFTYLAGDWLHVVCDAGDGRSKEWLTQHQLPWFLSTLRPQGYLGRKLARWLAHLPSDPAQWSLPQILWSMQHVSDPIGAVALGSAPARPAHLRITSLSERDAMFDDFAEADTAQHPAGSSAAGEQPKFMATVCGQPSIVKFTPPRGTPFGERWRSLLMLEKLALDTLHAHGVPSAHSHIVQTSKRSYLQSERFDRHSNADYCHHVVAIAAIHDEFVGGPWQNWVHTAAALAQQGLITPHELQQIARIFAFGHYIGNTDMHSGNLSFYVDDVTAPKIRLAPVYDMLPMMWRPDIHSGNLDPTPLREARLPIGYAAEAELARSWAFDYWQQAGVDVQLSAELRALCKENARRLLHGFD